MVSIMMLVCTGWHTKGREMRTTITLESDVAEQVRERMHARKSTLKDTINTLLRRGLQAQEKADSDPPFAVEPNASGFVAGVDSARLNQLLDDLDVEAFNAESRRETAPKTPQ